ncbi:MAG: aminodeoxychorismate synthase, component I, partial [Gemmataceae bacterium]
MNTVLSHAEPTPADGLVLELQPCPDPWTTCRQLADLPHLLFLDSARGGSLGRYSFLSVDPYAWLVDVPLDCLAEHLGPSELPVPHLPPFQGGLAGLWSYELGQQLECVPRARFNEFRLPTLAVGLYDLVLSWDHAANRGWLLSTGQPESGQARRSRAASRLHQMLAWL